MNDEPPSDSAQAGWKRNLWAVWAVVFISISGANLIFPFMPLYLQDDLGVTDKSEAALWAGLLGASTGAMMFVFSPIWGSLADRYGRKAMLQRAVIAAMIVMFLQGLAQEPWQLLVLRALQGAFAGTVGAATALVAAGTPRRHLGYAMGLVQTAQFSSQMFGPVIGGVLATAIGFRSTFIATSSLYAVGALLVFFVVEEGEGHRQTRSPDRAHRGAFGEIAQNLRDVARQRALLLVIGILFLLGLSTTLVRPVLSLVVQDATDGNAALNSGFVFAAFAFTSAFAALFVGRATQAVGYRRWLAFSAAGAATFYVPVAMTGSVAALALFMAVVGLFSGAMLPTTNALIGALSPRGREGSSFGVASSAQALTMAVGPLLGGGMAAAFGVHAGFVAAAAVLYVAALLAALFVREPSVEMTAVERAPGRGRRRGSGM